MKFKITLHWWWVEDQSRKSAALVRRHKQIRGRVISGMRRLTPAKGRGSNSKQLCVPSITSKFCALQKAVPFPYALPARKKKETHFHKYFLGSNGNEGVLCIPQSSSNTRTSPSDYLMSYPGHLLVVGGLTLCRDAVNVFNSPSGLGNTKLNAKTVLIQIIHFSISTLLKCQNSSISNNSVSHKYTV